MKNLIYHSAPKGVRTREELKELQKNIGVAPDGVWSAASEAAYEKYLERFREPMTAAYQVEGYYAPGMVRNQKDVKMMQELLGNVAVDGVWGPETDSAYWQRIALEEARDSGSVPEVSATLASRISAAIANTKPVPENGMPFPAKAAPRPVVDNAPGQQYTQGSTAPKPQLHQETILPALMRPMASATNRPTVRPEPQPYFGKEITASEKTPIQADYEALKRFSYRDISDRPSVYEEPGTGRTRPPKEGDTSKGSDGRSDFSTNKDAVIVYASNLLNLTTARENKEACCNLYSVMIDGERHYFTGEIFVGELDNVIVPYLSDALWEWENTFLNGLLDSKRITYEGFMHSHPYDNVSDTYSGGIGDTAVAMLSGNIYLTTPKGHIYDLVRPEEIINELLRAKGGIMSSALTQAPANAKDVKDYQDALIALKGWFKNPPEVPYNNLHSVDTTGISIYNQVYDRNMPKVIINLVQRYWEKEHGPLGFDLYEAYKNPGYLFDELRQQLGLFAEEAERQYYENGGSLDYGSK